MNKIILLFTILFIYTSVGFCQGTNDISEVSPLNKGKVILTDGTAIDFKHLSVILDTVYFTNLQSMPNKYSANNIYKISKTGNRAAGCAISAGLGWMLGAWIGTMNWDHESSNAYIFGGAIICTAIGGIIGVFIKKEKIIYKNQVAVKLTPLSDFSADNKIGLMLTCRISIHSKY